MSFMWHNITSKATVNKPSSQEKKKCKETKTEQDLALKKKKHHTTQRCNFGKTDN